MIFPVGLHAFGLLLAVLRALLLQSHIDSSALKEKQKQRFFTFIIKEHIVGGSPNGDHD